jgi:hypothetical protein
MSSSLCKKERGNLLPFRIAVKEDHIPNSFHTTSVTKGAHRLGPSFDFHKSSFDKVRGANHPPGKVTPYPSDEEPLSSPNLPYSMLDSFKQWFYFNREISHLIGNPKK